MIVEKRSRFFRLYDLRVAPRKKKGVALPLVGAESLLSLFKDAVRDRKASMRQANGDYVELIKAEEVYQGGYVALLFHRASPDAPDPIYRKRSGRGLNLRPSEKEDGEEQAYSAHMIIETEPRAAGRYRAALEEIPGLSASAVVGILRMISSKTKYECFDDKGKPLETYTVIQCDGYSSESLEDSLTTGRINHIDLSRDPEKDLEQDGAYIPSKQHVKLKVSEAITRDNWKRRISEIMKISDKNGYDDVRVTIDFDDNRSKTITIDRSAEAAEVMLVRSKQFDFATDLDLCYVDIHFPIIKTGIGYIKSSSK